VFKRHKGSCAERAIMSTIVPALLASFG